MEHYSTLFKTLCNVLKTEFYLHLYLSKYCFQNLSCALAVEKRHILSRLKEKRRNLRHRIFAGNRFYSKLATLHAEKLVLQVAIINHLPAKTLNSH